MRHIYFDKFKKKRQTNVPGLAFTRVRGEKMDIYDVYRDIPDNNRYSNTAQHPAPRSNPSPC